MGGIKGGGQQVPVVSYTMSMHYGIGISADALTGIYAQQKTVWEGNVTANSTININNPGLFGGPKAQGGMVGQVYALFGLLDQVAPLALARRLGLTPDTCPAFRGLLTALFCSDTGGGFQFQYNSPNIPPVAFKVMRSPKATGLNPDYALIPARGHAADRLVSAGWNENVTDSTTGAPIVTTGTGPTYGPTIPDANPAHLIYELLINPDWGLGLDPSGIETATFEAAAQRLSSEQLGLSFQWTSQDTIDALTTQILGTINGALYVRPSTGKFELTLFRPDYGVEGEGGVVDLSFLRALNQHNTTVTSFSRKMPGELANEVVVDWTNPLTEQTESITIQDPGSIANQGGIISQRSTYPGVRNELLAVELGRRDLQAIGAPLGVIESTVDRTQWDLVPGQVVTLTYPEYGLDHLVCRIIKIDYGKPGDAAMKVNLLEEIFGATGAAYVVVPPTQWEDPKKDPAPVTLVLPLTLPYFMLLNLPDGGAARARDFAEATVGFLAAPPVSSASGFELEGETTDILGNVVDTDLGTRQFVSHGTTTTALPRAAATSGFVVGALVGFAAVPVGSFVVFGDTDRNMEICMITAYDGLLDAATLARGLLDTIPKDWPIGTGFYLLNTAVRIEDPEGRAAGDEFEYRLLTIAGNGRLSLALAPIVSFTPSERPFLPNRPANVLVAGSAFAPVNWPTDDDIPVSWANRNRTTEDSRIVYWAGGDVPGEDGQSTTLIVWPENVSAPITTFDDIAGTDTVVPVSAFDGEDTGWIQVLAKRDGLPSLQGLMIHVGLGDTDVTGVGYGYDYGNNYGGFADTGGGGLDDWITIPNDTGIVIDGQTWQTLNANLAYSLLYSPSRVQFKFEVRNGEHYHVGAPWDDPPETMRSEVYGPAFAFNTVVHVAYGLTIASGQEPTTNQWFIVGQMHVGAFVGTGGSPPLAINIGRDGLGGEQLEVARNYQPVGTSTITYSTLAVLPGFERDRRYFIEWLYVDSHGGPAGRIKVTIDGVVLIDFTGVTGYSSATSGSYPKFGTYTGGNGSTLDLPLPGQDIFTLYDSFIYRVAAGVVANAVYISATGDDASTSGVKAAPVRTTTRAKAIMDASGGTRSTVYFMAGDYSISAWPFGAGQTWDQDPTDAPGSATLNITAANLGATSVSNITVQNLKIRSARNDGSAALEFVTCSHLHIFNPDCAASAYQSCILIYNPGPGLEIQGGQYAGPTIGTDGAHGVFPVNIVVNDGRDYDDPAGYKIGWFKVLGGTFAVQIQCIGVNGIWAYWQVDGIDADSWGNSTSTIGNAGISLAGSANPANHDNSCFGHRLIQSGSLSPAAGGGVETTLAGCTHSGMTIEADYCVSIGEAPGAVFEDNDLMPGVMAFSNDGPEYTGDDIEIAVNQIDGSPVTGAGSPTNLLPLPSATGLTRYAHSAPYVP